uniref:RRM domain-containing protein n=1 Tax=Oryza punctata TaxID=4537 RepID=A0A0E0JIV2_ORYPU
MDYISPDRSLEGACGDPGPLFGGHEESLLEHMDFHGDPQHVSPQLNEGLLVDSTDQISYLAADSPPFMNDQIPCNTMKSASTSPASPLKEADDHHVHIDSDMENDAAEQNLHDSYSEAQTTSLGYGVHRRTQVVDSVQPTELHESNGNDTSNFQQETTQSDTYLGDAMLNENGSRDYQLNNSGADDDEIPNSPALQMEDVDTRVLHESSHDEKYEAEDDQMNGRNSSPCDEHEEENCNSVTEPSYLEVEHENPGTKNGMLTPSNQWDSPPESSARLEKGTPSPDRMVSLPVGRSPRTHSPKELESPRAENEKKGFAQEERLTKERLSIKEKGLTKEGLPIKEKRLTKEGLSIKEKRLTKEGLSIKEKRLTKEGLPIKEKGLPIKEKGLPIKEKRLTKEGIPIKEKRFTKEGLPIKEKGLTKEGFPIKEKGLTKKGLPTKEAQAYFSSMDIHFNYALLLYAFVCFDIVEGIHHGADHLLPVIVIIHLEGRGFSYATTERDLEKKFSKYGRVTSARVVRDKRSGDSRGFGFLSLEKDEDADAAIRACDETEWNGRIILVEKSKAPTW